MARLIVSGTPAATVDEFPKLDRMSWRTTPLWVRTSGPFEPSPGNGPAVSAGISVLQSAVADAPTDAPAVEPELAAGVSVAATPHAASPAATPPKPRLLSSRRR